MEKVFMEDKNKKDYVGRQKEEQEEGLERTDAKTTKQAQERDTNELKWLTTTLFH